MLFPSYPGTAYQTDKISTYRWQLNQELEQIRSKRAGRKGAEDLDPAWLNIQVETNGTLGSRKVAAPWGLGELYAYQVWAELAKECLHHAELWMACTLTKEAERHAKVHGDGRTLRDLAVTKGRIAMEEGNHSEAVRILRELTAADLGQCSEAAVLLANAYEARKQPFPAQEIFNEALAAINQSPGSKAPVKKPKAGKELGKTSCIP